MNYTDKAVEDLIEDWEDIDVAEETQVIALKINGETPQLSMDVANTMVQLLKKKSMYISKDEIRAVYDSTYKSMEETEDKLVNAAENLKLFKEKNKLLSLSNEENALITRHNQIETEYKEAVNEQKILSSRIKELERQIKYTTQKTTKSIVIADNPVVVQLKNTLREMENRLANLLTEKTELHPDVVKLKAEISRTKEQIRQEVEKTVNTEVISSDPVYQGLLEDFVKTETNFYTTQAKIEGLSAVLKESEKKLVHFPAKEIEYIRLNNIVEEYTKSHNYLKRKLDEMAVLLQTNMNEVSIKVIDSPYVSTTASSDWPIWPVNIIVGLFLSFNLSFGTALFLEYWNDTVKRRSDIEEILDVQVLGVLPYKKHGDNNKEIIDFHQDGILPNLKMIAINLLVMGGEVKKRIFVITSTWPSEGKTTVAYNLSSFYSRANKETLLISNPSEDLFKELSGSNLPTIESSMGNEANFEVLPTLQDSFFMMKYDNYSVDLYNSDVFKDYVDRVRKFFDIAFIDSKSLKNGLFSLYVGSVVDGVILVVEAEKTKRCEIIYASEQIEKMGGRLIGVILNKYSSPIPKVVRNWLTLGD